MEVSNLLQIPGQEDDLVILDLDNTLYDYSICHSHAQEKLVDKICQHFNLNASEAVSLYRDCRQNVHHRLHGTASSHSRFFYIQEMTERICNKTDYGLINTLHDIYWNSFIEQMQLFDDVIPFLDLCKAQRRTIIIVTDMTAEIQFKKIKKLNIEKYISFCVTSEEAGVEKPHPYIFEMAVIKATKVKNNITSLIVVGDDIKKDVYLPDRFSVTNYNVLR